MPVSNLKGVAWDVVQGEDGRYKIARLDPMPAPSGELMENDVFASDETAEEFVVLLAANGDEEARQALLQVAFDVGVDVESEVV